MTRSRVAALVLGMTGIGILLLDETETLAGAPWGALCTLAAAISWAAGLICLKKVPWRVATLPLAGWQLLIGGLPFVGGAFVFEEPHLDGLSTMALGAVAFTIAWPICFNHWAFFKVVSIFPASVAAIGTMLAPVIGVFASALLLGESVGWPELSALVLVCAALALEMRPAARR
jgi:drug/metabolite transporter (DMT)-like permease